MKYYVPYLPKTDEMYAKEAHITVQVEINVISS